MHIVVAAVAALVIGLLGTVSAFALYVSTAMIYASVRFLEEWHQKLHNNTTPDDIVICEAYLAFVYSNGDLGQFYDTLSRGGVSRERLRNFERPILTDPEFYPDKRDGLGGDFEHFLRILKSVHSGTDLDTAAGAVRGILDANLDAQLNTLYELRQQGADLHQQATAITILREGLDAAMARQQDSRAIREMLYLDLALEQLLRGAIEQQQGDNRLDRLTSLAGLVLRNLSLDREEQEFPLCTRDLQALLEGLDSSTEWALHCKSVTDRAGRLVNSNPIHMQPNALEYVVSVDDAQPITVVIAGVSHTQGVQFWFVATRLLLAILPELPGPVVALTFAGGGPRIVTAGDDGWVYGLVDITDVVRFAQGIGADCP